MMKVPVNPYGDICLLINTRGEIFQNNRALEITDQTSPKLEGIAFEVNNVMRQKQLDIKNGKEVNNSIQYVGAAFAIDAIKKEGTTLKNEFYSVTVDREKIKDIPADNNGFVHIDIRDRKDPKEGMPTHSIIASPKFYNGYLDQYVVKEMKISKEDLLNPKLAIPKEITTKEGEKKTVETIALTLTSNNKLQPDKYKYPQLPEGVAVQATVYDVNKEDRMQKIEQKKEKKQLRIS
ncbi:MAG TPA: hypothetical protein PKW49_07570 [Paludibacteraceae bacterium]|jgi:hypothetical protein|nr:hypothetical protein [Paludibacteraceae bacterium]HQJ89334.1 hypothetical protein [Paludibacteraceae bacterium]